jgi:hypothetical protein
MNACLRHGAQIGHGIAVAAGAAQADDRPFERRFRDVHTAAQQAQGRQAHYETISRVLFGLAPDTTMFAF